MATFCLPALRDEIQPGGFEIWQDTAVDDDSSQSNSNSTIEALLAALQAGHASEENFLRLFLLYRQAVFGFFARRGLAPEDCHDLTQETFLGIHRGMRTFRLGEPFEPWLFTVAANAWRKHLRYRGAGARSGQELSLDAPGNPGSGSGGPQLVEEAPGPEDNALASERQRRLLAAIDKLPEQMRACLVLRLHQGLGYREIAAVLKRSVDTVKTHLAKARQRLKAELSEEHGRSKVTP